MGTYSRSNHKSNRPSKVKGMLFKAHCETNREVITVTQKIINIRKTDSSFSLSESHYSKEEVSDCYHQGRKLVASLVVKNKYARKLDHQLDLLHKFMQRFSNAEEKSTHSLS